MRRFAIQTTFLAAAIFAVLTLMIASARAANNPSPVLDAAASYVAGHPVSVWCETSWSDWLTMTANNGVSEAGGFTRAETPVVYLAPDVCEELHALVGKEDVGSFFAADAILTLTHESVHQRGVMDEAVTDCTALGMVSQMATTFFSIPKTVVQQYVKLAYKRVAGKRVRVSSIGTRYVANPFLARLVKDATRWHDAKPAQYHGSCG